MSETSADQILSHVIEAEAAVSQRMIDGTIDHPRLAATIRDVDNGSYDMQIKLVRSAIAASTNCPLRDALVDNLAIIVRQAGVPVAMTQIICMAFYRSTWKLVARVYPAITLDMIRSLTVGQSADLIAGFTFGQHRTLPLTDEMMKSCHDRLGRLLFPPTADKSYMWAEQTLEREEWTVIYDDRIDVIQNGIHNAVMRDFFIRYLGPDHLDDRERHAHHLVIDMLEDAIAYPQLHGFIRGVGPTQRQFRLSQITQALVAVHDMATRLHVHGGMLSTEEQRGTITHQVLALQRKQVSSVDQGRNLLISCCYAPFTSLVDWVHKHTDQLRIPVVGRRGSTTRVHRALTRDHAGATASQTGDTTCSTVAVPTAPGDSPFGWTGDVASAPPTRRATTAPIGDAQVRPVAQVGEAALGAMVRRNQVVRRPVDMKSETDVVEMAM